MPATPVSRRPVVLIVDDKPANLLALEGLLGDTYQIIFAASGRAALSTVQARPDIDLIVMDVQMPGMDGFETARQIKGLEAGRGIPIIFVTAVYQEDPFIKKGYEVGGIDYFGKPFDPGIFKMKVGIYASLRTRENLLKDRERQVRDSEELLRVGRKLSEVVESLSVGVLIADVEGRICQSTEEVSRILKLDEPARTDLYGNLLGWWDGAGRMIQEGGPLPRALCEGKSSRSEPITVQCMDGSIVTIIASAAPLHGVDGRIAGAVVLIKDITEPKKIEEALEERVTRLIGAGLERDASSVRPR